MKIKTKIAALFLCFVMLTPSLCSCGLLELVPDFLLPDESDSYHEIQDMVSVSVEDGEYYTVTSQNPIRVNKGGTATFTIEIREGYEFASATEGEYKDGVLTVSSVIYPTTISVALKKESVVIGGGTGDSDDSDDDFGDNGDLVEGETPPVPVFPLDEEKEEEEKKETEIVSLTVPTAKDGYHFICWTLGKSAENGGEVLTAEESGEFELPVGTTPIANFVDNEHFVILYRTNGGTTKDGKDYYYQTFNSVSYYMPNTVYQNGTFLRDGYVLTRYTTKKDGTGDYTTLGGKIETNDNGFVELWLRWARTTNSGFGYSLYTDDEGKTAACVNSYTGKAINVVIPEKITDPTSGITYPVKKIAAGAFRGVGMSTLVIPSTIHTIEDGAFVGCKNLHTITVHDNLWQVSDAAFSECDNLATYYLNAAHHPVFAGSSEGLFCLKYEKLRMAARNGDKKIMVMSGSSSLYGFSATQMEEAFLGEYTVINYGTNAGANGMLYLEAFARFFGEGDIIIHAPEMNNANYFGTGTTTYLTFRGTEAMYEIFSYVDMRNHPGFFDGLCDFNQNKRNGKGEVAYDRYDTSKPQLVDKTSDMPSNKDVDNYKTTNPKGSNPYNKNSIKTANTEKVNAFYAKMKAQGTEMYYSFAPVNKASLKDSSLSKANQDAYVARLSELLDYEVISHPSDYILEQIYFNNSDYHPGVTGRQMRTAALIADLKAQLIKEGKWKE